MGVNFYATKKHNYFLKGLWICALILLSAAVNETVKAQGTPGQVSCGYAYSSQNGSTTFNSMTGSTILATNSGMTNANYTIDLSSVSPAFIFDFNGIKYNKIGVNTNGYLWFGNTAPTATINQPIASAAAVDGIISGWGVPLQGFNGTGGSGSSIAYVVSGTSPNRILSIQWTKTQFQTNGGEYFNLQIVLYEDNVLGANSNRIDFLYSSQSAQFVSGQSGNVQIGLRGSSNTDFNNRTGAGGGGFGWKPSQTSAGGANTAGVSFVGGFTASYISGNNRITFTPTITTPTISASGPQSWCSSPPGSVVLTANTTITSPTYQWQTYTYPPSNTDIAGEVNATYNAAPTAIGTYLYVVKVTNGTGCSRTSMADSVFVNNCTGSTCNAPTASYNSPLCVGDTLKLSATDTAGATYFWTGPNNFSNQQNPFKANITLADTGTYSVTAVVNGCTSPATKLRVLITPAPATPVASNTGPYCTGGTMQLNASTIANATYNWTGPNSFPNTQNPGKTNITVADSGTYSVVATVSGCKSAPATTRVIISPPLSAPILSSNSPLCAGDTIKLTASNINGATFNWTGPNNFTNTQNPVKPNSSFADSGNYTVVATLGACSSAPVSTRVSVKPVPATPVASSNSPLCTGDSLKLSSSNITNATYSWTGPNSFSSATQNPVVTDVKNSDAGLYIVIATLNGCKSIAGNTTVVINPAPATPTLSYNGPLCAGDTLKLTATDIINATYSWTGPGSFTSSTQNPIQLNVAITDSGDYTVTTQIGNCKSAAGSIHVSIVPLPGSPVVSSNSPVCEGSTLNLTADNIPGATFSWTGPASYNIQNPTKANATTADSGTYSVIASVGSCSSSAATISVIISPAPVVTGTSSNTPVCSGASLTLSAPSVPGVTYLWNGPNSFSDTTENPARANMAFADSGDYIVVGQLGACTSSPVTVHISVIETPTPPTVTTSNSTICGGDSTQLCVNDIFTSYKWNNTTSTSACTFAKQVGGYWVTVTAANGCSVSSQHLTVTTFPSSSVSIIVKGDTLTSYGATAYQWFVNDTLIPGATGSMYIATRAGNYSVRITDANGCRATSSKVAVDPRATGIDELDIASDFNIYPNPASGTFNLSYTGAQDRNMQLIILNLVGQRIYEEPLNVSNGRVNSVNISSLAKGMYLVQLQQHGKNAMTTRIVVQ